MRSKIYLETVASRKIVATALIAVKAIYRATWGWLERQFSNCFPTLRAGESQRGHVEHLSLRSVSTAPGSATTKLLVVCHVRIEYEL